MAASGATYDWDVAGESVDPYEHDLGLIFLSAPITLPAYPLLAQKPLAAGAKVLNIGRIHQGQVSNNSLYVSKPVTLSPGSGLGFPYDYAAVDRIESGDSGGPDMLPGAAPHTIVAVNSGAGAKPSKPVGPKKPAKCVHDLCTWGDPLEATCDPCVAEVCAADAFCCESGWDAQGAVEVESVCPCACGD